MFSVKNVCKSLNTTKALTSYSYLVHWQAKDGNMRKTDGVYVLFCVFKMFKMIEHPANHEIQSVILFMNASKVTRADIHHQICEVHSENAMSDVMVRKWVRKFNEGRA